ncbi:hypothetical protein LVB77_01195 [Lysobacter sp. 5GHs7-4]|uniref:pYEATS domain-containing protein n=1 Tax=Lysobacter sp. 5GHs7-4 TaxID=2904253 RepID=UPI001E638657|nr:pYEATS domain-containing protein [Lysobacter sp. 5GHs7-4]UHQ23360.1 hypothetical protein LVB77_01195 [Lysobacter sp. 5GHs7-4]
MDTQPTPRISPPSSARERDAEPIRPIVRAARVAAVLAVLILLSAWLAIGLQWKFGAAIAGVLCAALAGTLLGFLFGIPRALTEPPPTVVTDPAREGAAPRADPGFSHNTNLEQISDWLTKIVVGVSLVQAREIADAFNRLSIQAAADWGLKNGATTAGFLLATAALLGFLASYIWTRTDFVQYLESSQSAVAAERRRRQEAERSARESKATLDDAVAFIARGTAPAAAPAPAKRVDAAGRESARPAFVPALRTHSALWDSDPNKNAFGGAATAEGRVLDATVSPLNADGSLCAVLLSVRILPGAPPLVGTVIFHLHPTFDPPQRRVVPNGEGAELRLIAAGAFTVGVEIEGEPTRLELDLLALPNLPQAFRDN